MFTRLFHAAISIVILVITYLGYAEVVVPMIEPSQSHIAEGSRNIQKSYDDFQIPDEQFRPLINRLFPSASSWERASETAIIATGDFLLLTQDPRRLDDGRLHLNPCTVIYQNEEADARTWIVQAEEGAVVTFEKDDSESFIRSKLQPGGNTQDKTALRVGRLGKPKFGYLAGRVVIQGSPTTANGSDGIQIDTSGVQFTPDTISTANEVHFQVGPNFGSGRDLTIRMDAFSKPGVNASIAGSSGSNRESSRLPSPSPSTIRQIELVHLEQATIFLPDQSHGRSAGPDGFLAKPAGPGIPVNVRCEGPVLVDIQRGMASINEAVRITRKRTGNAPEQLQCDQLAVTFRRLLNAVTVAPVANVESNRKDPAARFQSAIPKLEPQKVIAVGSPAIITTTTGSGADQRWHQVTANRLAYDLSEFSKSTNGTTGSITNIGNLVAQGPGNYQSGLSRPGEPITTELKLFWQDGIQVRPVNNLNQSTGDLLELVVTGDTRCEIERMGNIQAQRMRVHMLTAPTATAAGDGQAGNLRLENILAEENVKIETEQMVAFVNSVNVNVHEVAMLHNPVASNLNSAKPAEDGSKLLLLTPEEETTVAEAPRRFQIEGQSLNATLERSGSDYQLGDIVLDGNIRAVELVQGGGQASDIQMTGDQFRLSHLSESGGVAVIHGSPADVRARQLRLVGRNIHLDRGQNQLWIDGPGAAIVPLPKDMAAQYPNRPPTADIRWKAGMRFDGQRIECSDSVLARGPAQDIKADQLIAVLTSPIHFGSKGIGEQEVNLQSIVADGSVQLENRTFDGSGLVSIDRAHVMRLDLDQQTQKIRGTGPGWVQTVRRGNPLGSANLTNNAVTQARKPVGGAGNPGSLSFLKVGFQQSFEGSLARRLMTFRGDVQSLYGPVNGWDDQISMAKHEDLRPQTVRMNCQQMDLFQLPGQAKDKVELVASGNTRVWGKSTEGQLFEAQAHRLKYHQSKDLMMLQGDGKSDAHLWYQERPGGKPSHLPAQQIRYWPRANRAKIEGAAMLEFNF